MKRTQKFLGHAHLLRATPTLFLLCYSRLSRILSAVDYLPIRGCYAGNPHLCAPAEASPQVKAIYGRGRVAWRCDRRIEAWCRQKAYEYTIKSAAGGWASPKDRQIFIEQPQMWRLWRPNSIEWLVSDWWSRWFRWLMAEATRGYMLTATVGLSALHCWLESDEHSQTCERTWTSMASRTRVPLRVTRRRDSPQTRIHWHQSVDGPRVSHGKRLPCCWSVL